MKKIMILGGSRYIIPVIRIAHRLGMYVITCDYLPENVAHAYADRYCDISIMDQEAVLQAAKEIGIDGIMSFACDPGVVTAAYVAEQMGLPFQCSYESARILQDKGLFRQFLSDHGFQCPNAKRYTDVQEPFADIEKYTWPVIVKPVDSAGSKGVTKVMDPSDLAGAVKKAVAASHNGAFIIEEFLTFEGYHSSADPFIVDGKIAFMSYSDQLFDRNAENPYTPAYIIWPTTMRQTYQEKLTAEIQRLMTALHVHTGIFNIETCVADGVPYIMEVSPRGGGCKIAELQDMADGVNLIENEIRNAVGMPLLTMQGKDISGCWCEMVIHAGAHQSGILRRFELDPVIRDRYIQVVDSTVKPGDVVQPFTGANMSLGDVFLHCDSREEMEHVRKDADQWMHIEVDPA